MTRSLAALALLTALAAAPTRAAAEKPIQLSLLAPVQIYSESESISGLRLSLLYGKNANFGGLDLSLVGHTTGNFTGVEFGLVGLVDGNLVGWQDNWAANMVGGTMTGFQWGLFNKARRVEGLQLGLVNVAGTIHGLQIGLVNVIQQGGWLPVMVLVNGNFN